MMNRLIHALVAFFVVAFAMAQNATSPPVSNRGHNLREVPTPPLQVGDVVTRLARTADGDFAVVFSSASRRTTLYRSINGGAYKALLSDSNATFSSLSQSFSAINTDGSVGANSWEFGGGQIAFSTLCKTTLLGLQVTARCMTWTYSLELPDLVTDKVIGIGDNKAFTRANNQPVQATVTFNGPFSMTKNGDLTSYLSYSTPDPRNSSSTFNYDGIFRANATKLTEILTPSLATVYGSWEKSFGVLFQEGPGNTIASQLIKHDPKAPATSSRSTVLQTGAMFQGIVVRDILVFARPDEEALYVRSNDPNLMARLFSYDGTKLNELFRSSSSIEGIGQREFNYPAMNNGRGLISLLSGNEFDAIALIRKAGDASLVVKNGDVINGRPVGKVRGNNLQTTAFNGCTGLVFTTNPDGTGRMFQVEDPCINTPVIKDGVVTIAGENLVQSGLTTTVLANDGKLIDAKVSASSISFTASQLAFGDNTLRVTVGDAKSGVVNIHVDPPPTPQILSFSCELTLVTSGGTTLCSWETANGTVTVNSQKVESKGSQTVTAVNTVNLELIVTGIDGTKVSQLVSIRVLPAFTSDVICAPSTDDVATLSCSFTAVGATPQSSIALSFLPAPTEENPEPIEEVIGELPAYFSDEASENGSFSFQRDRADGSYIVRLQSPGFGVGGNEQLQSDPKPIVVPPVAPPPDGATTSRKTPRRDKL